MESSQKIERSRGWSPELLTVLGAMLAIGVGLAGLILNAQAQVRGDVRAMESRIRADMAVMESRIRADMALVETRIREDVSELRGDVSALRGRVSRLEGRFDQDGMPAPLPADRSPPASRS